jgi:uncharacterized membrane protein (DUF485 family)
MTRPNLDDPEALKAYRKELRGVGRPMTLTGFAISLIGLICLIGLKQNWLPFQVDPFVVFGVLIMGWGLLVWAFFKRNIYHRNRMAEPLETEVSEPQA